MKLLIITVALLFAVSLHALHVRSNESGVIVLSDETVWRVDRYDIPQSRFISKLERVELKRPDRQQMRTTTKILKTRNVEIKVYAAGRTR